NAFTAVQEAYHDAFATPEIGEALYQHAFYGEPYNGVMVQRNGEWSYCPTPSLSSSSPSLAPPSAGAGQDLLVALAALARRAYEHLKKIGGEYGGLGDALDGHAGVLEKLRTSLLGQATAAPEAPAKTLLGRL